MFALYSPLVPVAGMRTQETLVGAWVPVCVDRHKRVRLDVGTDIPEHLRKVLGPDAEQILETVVLLPMEGDYAIWVPVDHLQVRERGESGFVPLSGVPGGKSIDHHAAWGVEINDIRPGVASAICAANRKLGFHVLGR